MSEIPSQFTSSPAVQQRATAGLAEMSRARDQSTLRQQGESYLGAIETCPEATDVEKLVASTLRSASNQGVYGSSSVAAQRIALQALAAGVGGAVGATLATLATDVMTNAYNSDDARKMSETFVRALEQGGTPTERLLAQAVSKSTNLGVYNSSAVGARRAAFEMTAAGLQAAPESHLADYGLAAMKTAYNSDDSRKMAGAVLPLLSQGAANPVASVVADAASRAAGLGVYNSSALNVQHKAMELIAAMPTSDTDVLLAALGTEAINGAYNSDDGRKLGTSFLASIEARGQDPKATALAAVARRVAGLGIYNSTAVGSQRAAMAQIVAGLGLDTIEVALARYAQASRGTAYNSDDQRTLGSAVLQEISSRSSDPAIQGLVTWTQQNTSSLGNSDAIRVQKDVLDGIIQGRLTPPALPTPAARSGSAAATPAVDPEVARPVVDPEMDAEAQRASLEQSIVHNRDLIEKRREAIQAKSAEAAQLQIQAREATEAMQALEGLDRPLMKTYAQQGRIMGASGLATAGATLAVMATAAPVAVAIAVACGVTCLVARVRQAGTAQELRLHHRELMDRQFQALELGSRASMAQATIAGLQTSIDQAEAAIQEADKHLQVFRMADAMSNAPRADATVAIEESVVMIGGLRIPKRAQTPTPLAE